jgi:hypothetical protein
VRHERTRLSFKLPGTGLDPGEQLWPEDLPGVGVELVGLVGGQEVVTGQDNPAQQQAGQPGGQFCPLRGRIARTVFDDEGIDSVEVAIGAGDEPTILPAPARVPVQPLQDRVSCVGVADSMSAQSGFWPVRECGEQLENRTDG